MTWAVKMADARYDGYDEGFEKGITTGREEGISIGLATGREEGISIGLERGAYETKLETARTFLSMGLSSEQVAQGTNLSLDVVQSVMESCDTSLSSVTG